VAYVVLLPRPGGITQTMNRKLPVSRLAAGVTAACTALCIGAAPTAAQTTTSQNSGQQLPNCAVTTARVGGMDVTEFFGLGGDVSGFGQAFGPTASVSKAATGTGATANATTDNTVTPNTAGAATDNTAGGTTTGDTTITPSVIGGNGTTPGAGGTAATTGTTGGTGTTGTAATGATGTTAGTGTTGAAGTGTTAGTAGAAGTTAVTSTTGATGTAAVTSAAAATMSPAQSCIRLEVANPSPGDLLQPGSYVVQGFAFDPTAPASMGSGISGIQVFLGDPNEGGQIVGSVGTGAATSTGATADNFGIPSSGAAAFGPQFGMAGFSVTVQITQEAANPDSGSQAGLFVSATAQNNERVGTVAVPISVVNLDATT
jgi:hypothetical protein